MKKKPSWSSGVCIRWGTEHDWNLIFLFSIFEVNKSLPNLIQFVLILPWQVLRPFLLRRLKKEVESQLPEKVGGLTVWSAMYIMKSSQYTS